MGNSVSERLKKIHRLKWTSKSFYRWKLGSCSTFIRNDIITTWTSILTFGWTWLVIQYQYYRLINSIWNIFKGNLNVIFIVFLLYYYTFLLQYRGYDIVPIPNYFRKKLTTQSISVYNLWTRCGYWNLSTWGCGLNENNTVKIQF